MVVIVYFHMIVAAGLTVMLVVAIAVVCAF